MLSILSNLDPHRRIGLFRPFLSVFSMFSVVNGFSCLVLTTPGYEDSGQINRKIFRFPPIRF
jgi:hypothetical protein